MKELGITKGLWVAIEYAGHYDLQLAPFYEEPSILDEENVGTEAYSNAFLCADAGNTAQKCGLLPSELLQQRDELREKLSEAIATIKAIKAVNDAAIKNTETK